MREIKFRAWNEVDRVMITDLNSPTLWHGILVPDADDILMQYTGLKDKSGTEIYEGDIVHSEKNKFGEDRHECWSVEYDENEARFICYNQLNSNRGIKSNCLTGSAECEVTKDYIFKLEVIGNIYENPELLK